MRLPFGLATGSVMTVATAQGQNVVGRWMESGAGPANRHPVPALLELTSALL